MKKTSTQNIPPMFYAAAMSCILPMGIGLIGSGLFIVNILQGDRVNLFWQPRHIFIFPIFLSLVIGTPLSAILACAALKRVMKTMETVKLNRDLVEKYACRSSALVHAVGLVTHCAILTYVDKSGDNVTWFILFLLIGAIINVFVYLMITAPFSLYCAWVFHALYADKPDRESKV